MIDFAGDLQAIFSDDLAEDAIYAPRSGGEFPVRVIRRRADELGSFGDARLVSETSIFLIPTASVAEPEVGDRIEMDSLVYFVQGAPIRDPRRLRWTIEAVPQ